MGEESPSLLHTESTGPCEKQCEESDKEGGKEG